MEINPLAVDLPYPSLDGIVRDPRSARIIAPAYAATKSELTALMQYNYHALWFDREGQVDTAKLLRNIGIAEMEHFEILGKMLLRLGSDPIYAAMPPIPRSYYSTANVSYSKTPIKMLMDDVAGEWHAIKNYREMVQALTNENVSAVISRILMDEELHLERLKTALAEEKGY